MLSICKLRVECVLNEPLLGLAISAVSSPPHVTCCCLLMNEKFSSVSEAYMIGDIEVSSLKGAMRVRELFVLLTFVD